MFTVFLYLSHDCHLGIKSKCFISSAEYNSVDEVSMKHNVSKRMGITGNK